MTKEEGIEKVLTGPPHVVILGAGASIASTIDRPEPSGMQLPSMANFFEILSLDDLITPEIYPGTTDDFEKVFSVLHEDDSQSDLVREIEQRIHDYFSKLILPPEPTIYDYLVMALRPKDVIATFNWDPFVYQAHCRNREAGNLPRVYFLHGSVSLGYCEGLDQTGPTGAFADPELRHEFRKTQLLYPVRKKDYISDGFIAREWSRVRTALQTSKRVTVFGYSAPKTDVEAMSLLADGWGDQKKRNLDQFEIIDVQKGDQVVSRWRDFIHTHHYDFKSSYFDSSLGQFPRRTGERFMHQFFPTTPEEAFQEPNPVPTRFGSLNDLWEWHKSLVTAEESSGIF